MVKWLLPIGVGIIIGLVALINILIKIKKYSRQNLKYQEENIQNEQLYKQQYETNYQLRKLKHDLNKHKTYMDYILNNENNTFAEYEGSVIEVMLEDLTARCENLGIRLDKDICLKNSVYDAYKSSLNENTGEIIESNSKENTGETVEVKSKEIVSGDVESDLKGIVSGDVKAIRYSQTDMIELLGNLFDNAIEASKDNGKYISVTISETEISLFIEVLNSKDTEIKPLDNNLATTKSDTEAHGYGTKIVDGIVEKLNGQIEREDLGDRFCCKVEIK